MSPQANESESGPTSQDSSDESSLDSTPIQETSEERDAELSKSGIRSGEGISEPKNSSNGSDDGIPELCLLQSDDSADTSSSELEEAELPAFDMLTQEYEEEGSGAKNPKPKSEDPAAKERREKNRKAAADCRKRQKELTHKLTEEIDREEKFGEQKLKEIQQARKTLSQLKTCMTQHIRTCPVVQKKLKLYAVKHHQRRLARQHSAPYPRPS